MNGMRDAVRPAGPPAPGTRRGGAAARAALRRWAIALALGAVLTAPAVRAADWAAISPGSTTMEQLRALHGGPSRTQTQRVDGRETQQWIYEGTRAPAGVQRMIVDFGLLQRGAFRPDVVRALTLEPRPGIFNVDIVLQGWGVPHRESPPGQPIAFFYESGLVVTFADDGRTVTSMVFTPTQPPASGPAAPRR